MSASENSPREQLLGLDGLPRRVTLAQRRLERAVLEHPRGREECAGARVHPADVPDQEIDGLDRLAAQLGVEVRAAGREAAAAQDLIVGERRVEHVVRELVGVPADW